MSGARVLLVDDSRVTRAVLGRTLREAGFTIIEARDGVEGAVVALTERPDVVVTDIEMPTLDGFPLLRLLKADPASAHIPVLILTSHGEPASRFWSLRTGADAYLTKDHRPEELVAVVSRLAELRAEPAADAVGSPPPSGALDVLARVARQLDASLLQATVINTMLQRGMAAADFHEAGRLALETVAEVVDVRFVAVAVREQDSAVVHVRLCEPLGNDTVTELSLLLAHGLELPAGAAIEVEVSGERGRQEVEIDLMTTVWLPLPMRDAQGIFALMPRDRQRFTASSSSLTDAVTSHLALVLDNARLGQRLRELSTLDDLTRQLNHRAIFDRLDEELARARRYKQPLSVVLCDFDEFKAVNDTYGHLAGDAVLREGAAVLRRCLRSGDVLGRYGGEEFLVVLPQVDLPAARRAAERLRVALEGSPIPLPAGGEVTITASFGVASREETGEEAVGDLLVSLADRRLYEAKAGGRNRVCP